MTKQMKVFVAKDGTVKIEAEGFTGTSCEQDVHKFSTVIGTIQTEEHKHEYFMEEEAGVTLHN